MAGYMEKIASRFRADVGKSCNYLDPGDFFAKSEACAAEALLDKRGLSLVGVRDCHNTYSTAGIIYNRKCRCG